MAQNTQTQTHTHTHCCKIGPAFVFKIGTSADSAAEPRNKVLRLGLPAEPWERPRTPRNLPYGSWARHRTPRKRWFPRGPLGSWP
eukprot:4810476-Alexandrium_andersonii.AAC.1